MLFSYNLFWSWLGPWTPSARLRQTAFKIFFVHIAIMVVLLLRWVREVKLFLLKVKMQYEWRGCCNWELYILQNQHHFSHFCDAAIKFSFALMTNVAVMSYHLPCLRHINLQRAFHSWTSRLALAWNNDGHSPLLSFLCFAFEFQISMYKYKNMSSPSYNVFLMTSVCIVLCNFLLLRSFHMQMKFQMNKKAWLKLLKRGDVKYIPFHGVVVKARKSM